MKKLLNFLIRQQRENPVLFFSVLGALLIWAGVIAAQSEIEAFPDLTNVQVQIITQYPGKAAEEVERQVTVPIEVATNGLPGLINQRSLSLFGLSVITLTFDDNVQSKQARIDVAQTLPDADIPDGVKPALSADSTPLGEIFRYTVKSDLPVDELRLIEDWRLEREFKSIPGVADVVSFGGPLRTIEVKLDLPRLRAFGLSVSAVAQALGQNHANAGGSFIQHGDESYVVRSLGLYESPKDLELAVVATQKGIPVRVRDLGSVQFSNRPRLGQVSINATDDVVEGIIMMRKGSDTVETCKQIRAKIEKLNGQVLPKGTEIVPYYDRTQLIDRSAHTVFHNIIEGVLLVLVVLIVGLGVQAWAMSLGVALIIPFALILAFVGLKVMGYAPNLISLGAVDFGIIVETAIFAAEAVISAIALKKSKEQSVISEAVGEVLKPAFFCALLLLIAFVPILSLQQVEGRIFKPLGITLISALIGGQIGALLLVPLFANFLPVREHAHTAVDRGMEWIFEACLRLKSRLDRLSYLPLAAAVVFVALLVGLQWNLGREFLPQLNEGSLWIRATAPQTISREASVQLASRIREKLRAIPEVINTVSQIGRPDDGTDSNGFDNIETMVTLEDPAKWTSAKTIDGFVIKAQSLLSEFEGVNFNFSQPIKDNVDEAISGVKGELVVKLFGPKLDELQKTADQMVKVLREIPGAADVDTEQLLGQPELRFSMNRELLASYGLRVSDAEEVLETALMGRAAARMLDEQGREVPILTKPNLREPIDQNSLGEVPIFTPEGAKIPLREVATPTIVEGVSRVYHEQGERRIAVKCSVRNRAVVEFVQEASKVLKEKITLPPNSRLEWSGSFANAERAGRQLLIIVPLCLVAMVILLFTWFGSWSQVLLLLWEIPFSLSGGLAALLIAGLNLSISAAAGGVVLVGVSFLTGLMLLEEAARTGDANEALRSKGRSILISSGVAIIGLIPAAFSTGIGSETARPFAVMILGGLMTSLLLTLTLLPTLIGRSQTRRNETRKTKKPSLNES